MSDEQFPIEPPSNISEAEKQRFYESVLVDYIMRTEEGESLDIDAYLARYPRYAEDLAFLLSQNAAPPRIQGAPSTSTRERSRGWPLRALGDYEVLFKVSAAGGGRVYKARRQTTGELCALKVISESESLDRREIERFTREAKILSELAIEGVNPVIDVREARDLHFMAMPWIDGATLAETIAILRGEVRSFALDAAALTVAKRAAIIADAARTLHRVHRRGVLHRDIKPSNVMLRQDLVPLLIDFGIARDLAATRLTKTKDAPLGTPRFLAPELLLGDAKTTSVASDVYALGMTAYEFITLTPAFDARERRELYEQIMRFDVKPPHVIDASIPRALSDAVMRAIDRNPEKRPADAEAFAAAIDAALSGAPAPGGVKMISVRKAKILAWLLTFAAAALTVVVAWAVNRLLRRS